MSPPITTRMPSNSKATRPSNANGGVGLLSQQLREVTRSTPSLVTATGPIYEVPGNLIWAPASEGIRTMAGLHVEASGSSDLGVNTQETAFLAYSNLDIALIAQIAVSPPGVTAELLREMCSVAQEMGGLDGMEGPFLSAARSLQGLSGYEATLDLAGQTLGQYGLPEALGGGATSSVVFDAQAGQLAFPDASQLTAMLGGYEGRFGAGVFGGMGSLFETSPALGGGQRMLYGDVGDAANYAGVGAAIGAFGGAVVGGVVGAVGGAAVGAPTGPGAVATAGAGGWAGAVSGATTGARLGAAVGGFVGMVVGFSKEDSHPSGSGSSHGSGSSTGGSDGGTTTGSSTGSSTSSGSSSSGTTEGGMTGASGTSSTGHAPTSSGSSSGGTAEGGMTGAGGTSSTGHAPTSSSSPKCPSADGETGFDGEFGGSNPVLTPTRMPQGDGLASLVSYTGGSVLSLITLPAYEYEGDLSFDLGYIAQLPGFASDLELITSPVGDGEGGRIPSGGYIDTKRLARSRLRLITIPAGVDGLDVYVRRGPVGVTSDDLVPRVSGGPRFVQTFGGVRRVRI